MHNSIFQMFLQMTLPFPVSLGFQKLKSTKKTFNSHLTGQKIKYYRSISNVFFVSTGIRNLRATFNDAEGNFIELKYLDIPLTFGLDDLGIFKKLELANSLLTIDLGVKYRILYSSSIENLSSASNFGLISSIEFKQRIANNTFFLVGYNLSADFNDLKKNEFSVKNKNENTLNLGINFNF